MHAHVKRLARQDAFTLAEISVVLVIIGLLTATLFPALTALRQTMAQSATETRLLALARASAAYSQTRGCLPCPTPATTSGAGFGIVRGDVSSPPAACGPCSPAEGLVPYASLGLPQSAAKDGWGRWITMRIDPDLAIPFNVIPPTTPCSAADVALGTCAVPNAAQKGLCGAKVSIAQNYANVSTQGGGTTKAALVLVSHGLNGYGSFVANPLYATGGVVHRLGVKDGTVPDCATGAEACNASYSMAFIDGAQGTKFDDLLLYLSRDALISLLGQPSCQTPWP